MDGQILTLVYLARSPGAGENYIQWRERGIIRGIVLPVQEHASGGQEALE